MIDQKWASMSQSARLKYLSPVPEHPGDAEQKNDIALIDEHQFSEDNWRVCGKQRSSQVVHYVIRRVFESVEREASVPQAFHALNAGDRAHDGRQHNPTDAPESRSAPSDSCCAAEKTKSCKTNRPTLICDARRSNTVRIIAHVGSDQNIDRRQTQHSLVKCPPF